METKKQEEMEPEQGWRHLLSSFLQRVGLVRPPPPLTESPALEKERQRQRRVLKRRPFEMKRINFLCKVLGLLRPDAEMIGLKTLDEATYRRQALKGLRLELKRSEFAFTTLEPLRKIMYGPEAKKLQAASKSATQNNGKREWTLKHPNWLLRSLDGVTERSATSQLEVPPSQMRMNNVSLKPPSYFLQPATPSAKDKHSKSPRQAVPPPQMRVNDVPLKPASYFLKPATPSAKDKHSKSPRQAVPPPQMRVNDVPLKPASYFLKPATPSAKDKHSKSPRQAVPPPQMRVNDVPLKPASYFLKPATPSAKDKHSKSPRQAVPPPRMRVNDVPLKPPSYFLKPATPSAKDKRSKSPRQERKTGDKRRNLKLENLF